MARMVRCACMAVCVSPGSHWSTKLLFSSSSSPPGAWAWPPAWRRCVGPCWAQQRKAAVMTHSITLDTKQRWTSNKKTTGRTNSLISVPEIKSQIFEWQHFSLHRPWRLHVDIHHIKADKNMASAASNTKQEYKEITKQGESFQCPDDFLLA